MSEPFPSGDHRRREVTDLRARPPAFRVVEIENHQSALCDRHGRILHRDAVDKIMAAVIPFYYSHSHQDIAGLNQGYGPPDYQQEQSEDKEAPDATS